MLDVCVPTDYLAIHWCLFGGSRQLMESAGSREAEASMPRPSIYELTSCRMCLPDAAVA